MNHSYNHNIDTSREHYANVITTRTFDDRLNTIKLVQEAGINVCCGGILGLGETREDRFSFIETLDFFINLIYFWNKKEKFVKPLDLQTVETYHLKI